MRERIERVARGSPGWLVAAYSGVIPDSSAPEEPKPPPEDPEVEAYRFNSSEACGFK